MTKAADTAQLVSGNGLYTDANGNVGIGTSTPGVEQLNGPPLLRLQGTGAGVVINDTTSGGKYAILARTGPSTNLFRIYDITAGADRLDIDPSGNVLIGKGAQNLATPGVELIPNVSSLNFGRINMCSTYAAGANSINFSYAGSIIGYIQQGTTSVTYSTTSDYRLKENVQPLTGALARIAALKPCTYTWKSTGEAGEGFIAHELAEVCPSAVTGEKDAVNEDGSINPQGIDTSFLVATLTAAIQELKAEVDQLRAQLEAK